VKPTEPLPLFHSWPIVEADRRFDLGWVSDRPTPNGSGFGARWSDAETLSRHAIGLWECDLADNSLTWSDTIYDLFGLPRGSKVARERAVTHYHEGSRAVMERLRAYSITHRRGFTLDAQILGPDARYRWMRLVAAPVCVGDQVVRLVGTKRLIAA
jgi:PAS domain-containing protein